jgi:hypothetical protein
MPEAGILATFSDVVVISDIVVVVAIVIAIIVGALFVGGRIAPKTKNAEPGAESDDPWTRRNDDRCQH